MPVPLVYENATIDFRDLLTAARDAADLTTTNQAYTMIEGVLLAFRRRLDVQDALRFADTLPAVAGAIFVSHWEPSEPQRRIAIRAEMTREVQQLRSEHNDAPASSIRAVAFTLRRTLDEVAFDRAVQNLPLGAAEFWAADFDHPDRR